MRPIDADALMKTVFNDVVLVDGEVKGVGLILAETVDKAPTIDAVPVVRCMECKYFMECKYLMFSDCYGECSKGHLGIVMPHDFCSYGERK